MIRVPDKFYAGRKASAGHLDTSGLRTKMPTHVIVQIGAPPAHVKLEILWRGQDQGPSYNPPVIPYLMLRARATLVDWMIKNVTQGSCDLYSV